MLIPFRGPVAKPTKWIFVPEKSREIARANLLLTAPFM